ncbi:aldose epimerase family protein [Prevotella dentasini]|uniref:aldose epimerase family protein n=1 Tax=Prevotella dentasini TaxID=589537 RepID=UPI000468A5E3|nr:aldose epimerase [Prevotella dentasini]
MKHFLTIWMACLTALAAHAQTPRTFRLTNGNGMEAVVSNYGARLMSLTAHNWNGRLEPVVKGFDSVDDYRQLPTLGATLLNFTSTTADALADNTWDVISSDNQSVAMRCTADCGEPGSGGKANISVTYTLTDQNALDIDYRVTSTVPVPLRLTNGIVFNLSGDGHRSILRQHLWLDAAKHNLLDDRRQPSGTLQPVRNTPLNFLRPREIGDRIGLLGEGYCHAFQLRHPDNMQKPAAILFDAQSGRSMTVYVAEPTLKVNTYGSQSNGISFQPLHSGFNGSGEAIDNILRPGQVFHTATVFLFATDPPLIMKTAK